MQLERVDHLLTRKKNEGRRAFQKIRGVMMNYPKRFIYAGADYSEYDHFIRGFKLGARMATEVLSDD